MGRDCWSLLMDGTLSDQVEHRCCWFHLIKAVGDHVRKEGLQKQYDTNIAFNEYIQQFSALALIDPAHIDRAFTHLKLRAAEFAGDAFKGLDNFLRYFE